METIFNEILMKSAADLYNNANAITSPDDPRMKMVQSALFTWTLKIVDFLPRDGMTPDVIRILERLSRATPFMELRFLLNKSQEQKLNIAERTRYSKFIKEAAIMLITEAAQATVCTIAQLGMEWAKAIKSSVSQRRWCKTASRDRRWHIPTQFIQHFCGDGLCHLDCRERHRSY